MDPISQSATITNSHALRSSLSLFSSVPDNEHYSSFQSRRPFQIQQHVASISYPIHDLRAPSPHDSSTRNLDIWTETVRIKTRAHLRSTLTSLPPFRQYGLGFYFNYLSRWPDMCCTAQHPSGRLMGYGIDPNVGLSV